VSTPPPPVLEQEIEETPEQKPKKEKKKKRIIANDSHVKLEVNNEEKVSSTLIQDVKINRKKSGAE
jgi:hypothetical protein